MAVQVVAAAYFLPWTICFDVRQWRPDLGAGDVAYCSDVCPLRCGFWRTL